jgi:squalene synthase HpnC
MTETEAFAYCRQLAKTHYENFHVAGWFLPKPLILPFQVVYAYCRCSDDIADEHDGSSASRTLALQQLADWERQLDHSFDSDELPAHPVFFALQSIVRQFQLPKEPFADLLTAFRQDQTKPHYETMDDLLGYCKYSANPVGRIVLHLIGKPAPQQVMWSDSICTALQLTNFWQDVQRDRIIGRCYIPQNAAEQFGVNLADLHDSPEFRQMMHALVADAKNRFEAGKPLIRSVPKNLRAVISLFIRGGSAVLDAIERIQFNVLAERPVLSRWKKCRLLARCLFS